MSAARRGFDRPRFLWVIYGLIVAYLFVPIIVVIVFSFNSSSSLSSFDGVSFRWYRTFWDDPDIKNSLVASFEVAAVEDEDPRLRIEEEFGHLGCRRLLDHGGVVKSRRESDDILIGDGHRSSSLPVP